MFDQVATKQQLRKIYLDRRTMLSDDNYVVLNAELLDQFKTLSFDSVNCIHIFLPISSRKEPDTLSMIAWLKQEHTPIKLVYPKTNLTDLTITHYIDDADLVLENGTYGITEPLSGHTVDVRDIDMVIVPLLAFDKKGYRAGYGKGFYDRFMAQCKPTTRFIGLSFFEPVDAIEDIDQYDIPLHQCITPGKIWTFS